MDELLLDDPDAVPGVSLPDAVRELLLRVASLEADVGDLKAGG